MAENNIGKITQVIGAVIDIKFTDRIMYYNAFDAYHVKHDLSAMENLLAGYVNARLDVYLRMLQE